MALFQWRRFSFFEKETFAEPRPEHDLKESAELEHPLGLFDDDFLPTVAHGAQGVLVHGDERGLIRTMSKSGDVSEWNAYDGPVDFMYKLASSHFLVTIGKDRKKDSPGPTMGGDTSHPVVKIWRLDQSDSSGAPVCSQEFPVFSSKFPAMPIACFAVLEDLSQLVVGLGNGAVLFFEGDLLRDRNPKRQLLRQEGPCVTGLHFRITNGAVSLFVVNTKQVTTYYTKRKGFPKEFVNIDDEGGADLKCSTLTNDNDLVLGRTEACYFYEVEEKGPCFGFEGEKKIISWFNNYLLVVTDPKKSGAVVNSEMRRNRFNLSVYDIKNKLLAFQGNFDDVVDVLSEWGALFVVTKRKVYQLREKDLPTKMQMFFRKHLYPIAISLALAQNSDRSYITDIYIRYGDHLYSKGEFDQAIDQYIETIGTVEPSFVIRKFLDAQRIHNLTRYLQALHEKRQANADHTTLLLNCYTKLKDIAKLDEFIKTDSGLTFDVETAIRVCRQASYFDHALFLAKKHGKAELQLEILMKDAQDYSVALDFIGTLDFDEAESYMKIFGKTLINSLPSETTELLKRLCTDYVPASTSSYSLASPSASLLSNGGDSNAPSRSKKQRARPSEFIHIFIGKPRRLTQFLEYVVKHSHRTSSTVYETLLEMYVRETVSQAEDEPVINSKQTPSVSAAFDSDGEEKQELHVNQKIMNLLKSQQASYDPDHALVLMKTYRFEPGVVFLYDKLHLYHEIVQHHMERGDKAKVIRACTKYNDSDPSLWTYALSYFASIEDQDCSEEIQEVLARIDRNNLLPPLRVVQLLAKNPKVELGVIKEFLIKNLKEETALVTADEREIANYREDTAKMREEITELRTSAKTFQGTKCHACTSALELPAVHFLCMHSYHQRCLIDNDKQCPKCAPEFHKVREMKNSMRSSAGQHDKFFKQLDASNDGFSVVAEYFGRGVINDLSG